MDNIKINSYVNNAKNWLVNFKTFIPLNTRKKAEDFFDDESIEENDSSSSLSIESKEEKNDNTIITISPKFSFNEYNSLISKKQKRYYIHQFLDKKIKISPSDPFLPLFQFDTYKNESHIKFQSLQLKEIPLYQRSVTDMIKGIKNNYVAKNILNDLNEQFNQKICTNDKEEDYLNDNMFLRHKRYFNRIIQKDSIMFKTNKKYIDTFSALKDNEAKPESWLQYIKMNLKNKEKLKLIFDKSSNINFEKENIQLRILQLRFDEISNIQYETVIQKFILLLKRPFSNEEEEKERLVIELLSYTKRNMMQTDSLSYIETVYCSLCELFKTQCKIYLIILFDFIHLLFQMTKYAKGMSILITLIEQSVLTLKGLNYQKDYEDFFNSNAPKLCDYDIKCGYLYYYSNLNQNNQFDFIDEYIDSTNPISYRAYNSRYKDIHKMIHPLCIEEHIKILLKQLWNLIINKEKINSLSNETSKYTYNFNKQLFTYIKRLCDFMLEINSVSNDVYMFMLNLYMTNENITLKEKFEVYSKQIFKVKSNQNNIELYCEFLTWAIYFSKYDLCDNIIKLLHRKVSDQTSIYYSLILFYAHFYQVIKGIKGLIQYKEISNAIIMKIKEGTFDCLSLMNIYDKIESQEMKIIHISNILTLLYLHDREYSFLQYEKHYLSLFHFCKEQKISKNTLRVINNKLISILSKYSYNLNRSFLLNTFSLSSLCLILNHLKKEPTIEQYEQLFNRYKQNFFSMTEVVEDTEDILLFIDKMSALYLKEEKSKKKEKIFIFLYVNLYSRISYNIEVYEKAKKYLSIEYINGIDIYHKKKLLINE